MQYGGILKLLHFFTTSCYNRILETMEVSDFLGVTANLTGKELSLQAVTERIEYLKGTQIKLKNK